MMPNRLREFREAAGLSLKALGEKVNRSYQAIAQYETGVQDIPDEILVKLSSILKKTSAEILQEPRGDAALVLKDQSALPSNAASLRMLEDEKKEYAAALNWMIARDTKDGDEFAREVWNSPLSSTAKHIVLGAALREQERRAKRSATHN